MSIECCEFELDNPSYEKCLSGVPFDNESKSSFNTSLLVDLLLSFSLFVSKSKLFILSINELLIGINELLTLGICEIVM